MAFVELGAEDHGSGKLVQQHVGIHSLRAMSMLEGSCENTALHVRM